MKTFIFLLVFAAIFYAQFQWLTKSSENQKNTVFSPKLNDCNCDVLHFANPQIAKKKPLENVLFIK